MKVNRFHDDGIECNVVLIRWKTERSSIHIEKKQQRMEHIKNANIVSETMSNLIFLEIENKSWKTSEYILFCYSRKNERLWLGME